MLISRPASDWSLFEGPDAPRRPDPRRPKPPVEPEPLPPLEREDGGEGGVPAGL